MHFELLIVMERYRYVREGTVAMLRQLTHLASPTIGC